MNAVSSHISVISYLLARVQKSHQKIFPNSKTIMPNPTMESALSKAMQVVFSFLELSIPDHSEITQMMERRSMLVQESKTHITCLQQRPFLEPGGGNAHEFYEDFWRLGLFSTSQFCQIRNLAKHDELQTLGMTCRAFHQLRSVVVQSLHARASFIDESEYRVRKLLHALNEYYLDVKFRPDEVAGEREEFYLPQYPAERVVIIFRAS